MCILAQRRVNGVDAVLNLAHTPRTVPLRSSKSPSAAACGYSSNDIMLFGITTISDPLSKQQRPTPNAPLTDELRSALKVQSSPNCSTNTYKPTHTQSTPKTIPPHPSPVAGPHPIPAQATEPTDLVRTYRSRQFGLPTQQRREASEARRGEAAERREGRTRGLEPIARHPPALGDVARSYSLRRRVHAERRGGKMRRSVGQ